MRQASAQLKALLASSTGFIMADLYTFTLVGGSTMRFSAAPTSIAVNGYTFELGPKFERTKTKVNVGVEVDELEVTIYPETTDTIPPDSIDGLPWTAAAWLGILDGALLTVERAFMPSYGDTSPGTITLFAGRVSDIQVGRSGILMKCRSHLELLNIQMPRRLWQSNCTHVFGGSMCQFDRSSRMATILAGDNSDRGQIITDLLPSPANLFNGGTATATSGLNAGMSRTITSIEAGSMIVKPIFPRPIAAGDVFQLLPGCDHTFARCRDVFNNDAFFGGFLYIPVPEVGV